MFLEIKLKKRKGGQFSQNFENSGHFWPFLEKIVNLKILKKLRHRLGQDLSYPRPIYFWPLFLEKMADFLRKPQNSDIDLVALSLVILGEEFEK